MKASCTTKWST